MYAKHVSTKVTKQTERARDDQVKNNAGGYVFSLDKWDTLDRFLVLGNEGGTYYCSEKTMTKDNARCVLACAKEDIGRTLTQIHEMRWRAPKPSPSIFALSLLISNGYDIGDSLNNVCKTATQLFEFIDNCKHLRGWGSRLKKVVNNWYLSKPSKDVAYQITKYQARNGWSHRDVLRLSHPKATNETNDVFRYICHPDKWKSEHIQNDTNTYLEWVEEAKNADEARTIELINKGLVRECINNRHLKSVKVWDALLENMPMVAMLRNLGNMSGVGLTTPFSDASRKIISTLTNRDVLQKAKLHPFSILLALKTYGAGCGFRGSNTWTVDQQILQALNDAYYLAFDYVEPTNKRYYLGIDCSGSMFGSYMCGSNITAGDGAAAMAMTSVKTEPYTYTAGFNTQMVPFNVGRNDSLQVVLDRMKRVTWGGTDCSLPMVDALQKKLPIDCFIVFTDNQAWAGRIQPFQALKEYRNKMGINAKLIVCGMTATNFTIADPTDKGMLDVVGFDTNVPSLIADFCK